MDASDNHEHRRTNPVVFLVITPAAFADGQRLADALEALKRDDDTFDAGADPVSRQVTIGGTSERHLEVLVDRLAREYKVAVGVGLPQVLYRPALTSTAEAAVKYARTTSEGGQYGHVVIRLTPREPGAGYLFENRVQGGAVPAQFIPAVDQGIQDILTREGFAGHPITDVQAELHDGSYHDVDSSEYAFQSAAAMATRDALLKAGLVLLEPIMRVDVSVPQELLPNVVKHLVSSGGRVNVGQAEGNRIDAAALVPMARLFGYESGFRAMTVGRGTCSIEFAGFAPVPASNADDDFPVGVRLRPAPNLRNSGIALPEPEEPVEE